jgi:hypothetical protein
MNNTLFRIFFPNEIVIYDVAKKKRKKKIYDVALLVSVASSQENLKLTKPSRKYDADVNAKDKN